MQGCVVAGIGTEVGKTLVSAILVEKYRADYWKPVQAGSLERSDTMTVRRLAPSGRAFHPEAYRLQRAMSPHAAAEAEGLRIDPGRFPLPATTNTLIIELAGGLRVPLAPGLSNIDLLSRWRLPVVLVSSYYLGSINHTLLSVEALASREVPLLGLVFNGDPVASSRAIILSETGLPCLLELDRADRVDAAWISSRAEALDL